MLAKTSAAIERVENSLILDADPMLKQLITQHLIVLAVAEAEDLLESIIIDHFRATTTPAAGNLAKSCLSSLLRSIKTSEISGFLNRLGETYKMRFQTHIDMNEQEETKYNNLIVNRHSVVHEAQCNITFEELQSTITSVLFVCDSVRKALDGT